MNFQKIATVGIEPTTLALLAPRSNQTELCGCYYFLSVINLYFKKYFYKKLYFSLTSYITIYYSIFY